MSLFLEFSILIIITALISIVMRLLKQPLLIGHILTGIIVGPVALGLMNSSEVFHLFSEIGIAILLFIVGLHLHPKTVKKFGKVSLLTGIGQVVFTSLAGFLVARALDFPIVTAVYIGVALAFSSTIIIMKLIADKGDMESLYGKISIGFLLVQDIVAILLLFFIPIFTQGNLTGPIILELVIKITLAFIVLYLLARYLLPRISTFISKSQELLFLFTIAWGLGISSLFYLIGFSIETGALIAGITLATLPAHMEISARLTPLRDFFIIIFFILLGAQMELQSLGSLVIPAIIFSALILVGNPIILMSIMGILGYKKKTSLQIGFTVAQVSEFSLILIALGLKLGHVNQSVLSLVTLVGLITIFGSTYLILYSDKIYIYLEKYLSIFERKSSRDEAIATQTYDVILFGCNRVGHNFLEEFKQNNLSFLVVDHDPKIIESLAKNNVNILYGDASDLALVESLPLAQARIIISTIPNMETNTLLNRIVQSVNPETIFIAVASRIQEAFDHYNNNVDYVILPHFLGSSHAAKIVMNFQDNKLEYQKLKQDHMKNLYSHIEAGHEHP